jgi:hypothetical protein
MSATPGCGTVLEVSFHVRLPALTLLALLSLPGCDYLCPELCESKVVVTFETGGATLSSYSGKFTADSQIIAFNCPTDPSTPQQYACRTNGVELYGTPTHLTIQVTASNLDLTGEVTLDPTYQQTDGNKVCSGCSQAETTLTLH